MTKQSSFLAAGLLSACLAWSAFAQNSPTTTPTPNPQATAAPKLAPGVEELLKMVKAGVSADVMVNYVENANIPYRLEPSDLIMLKEQGVPDAVTTAMLKRGAVMRTQIDQVRADIAARNTGGTSSRAGLDPEGYDYFQYYYLYPRTLQSANQRLYGQGFNSHFPSAFSYAPAPFQAYSPSAFRRR
jgi:hypothetical protein